MARTLRIAIAIAALIALQLVSTPPASAGGSWLYPVQDKYEVGDTATMVGYFGSGSYGPVTDEPFYAYLFAVDSDLHRAPRAIPLPVGELTFTPGPEWGQTRAAVSFDLPNWMTPGKYELTYCNRGCERKVGDLIGGYLDVGRQPDWPVTRSWPIGEPEILNLADDAQVSSLGTEKTASEVRTGAAFSAWLDISYLDCVNDAGFDLVGVQVLVNDSGLPYYVKTGVDVPAEFHGPCFESIGGGPSNSSSYDQPPVANPPPELDD